MDFTDPNPNALPVTTGGAGSGATAGTAATAGTSGTAGATGAAGTTGAAGVVGTAGHSGAAGSTGVAGATGAAGSTGVAGNAGVAGSTAPPPPPIPCGMNACAVGVQKCCISPQTQGPTCIGVSETCDSGVSLSCIDTASCGAGAVCCVSTAQALSTTCQAPAACVSTAGFILCASDRDCPRALGNCCGIGNLRVCRARACRGGGPGGGAPGGGGRGAPPPGN